MAIEASMDDQKPNLHYFTDDDVRQILKVQGDIQTDIAVTANNVKWFISTYKSQLVEIAELKKKIEDLNEKLAAVKNTLWKYIGVGIGIAIAVELIGLALTIAVTYLWGK